MTPINVTTVHQHQDIHTIVLNEKQLIALGIAALADRVGVDAQARNISSKGYLSCTNRGSLNSPEYELKVTLTVDHRPREAGAEPPAVPVV